MKDPVDAHVGKQIRHRRWVVGMTQQQLADKVGVKFQQMQKYETGVNRVAASRLWYIADALTVPIQHFFDGLTGDPWPTVSELTQNELARIAKIRTFTPKQHIALDAVFAAFDMNAKLD